MQFSVTVYKGETNAFLCFSVIGMSPLDFARLYNGFKQMGFTITLGDYNQMSLYLSFRVDLSGE